MRSVAKKFVKFLKREDGPTAVKQAVTLAPIVVVCVAAIVVLGRQSRRDFRSVGRSMTR